ncbi:MAG TPA: ABC transporter permease [Thermodesulfovibrionales bacterium]|nr:ABC transporter permease [Thermodesulfovibrionales bacterium]
MVWATAEFPANQAQKESQVIQRYIIKRILLLIPLLLGITLLTFSLTKALPGDPALSLMGERTKPEVIERIRKELGSDKPFFIQYSGYIKLLLKGEFGRSYYTNRKVAEDLLIKFPNTLLLAVGAMTIAVPAGIIFGFLSALRRGTVIDRTVSVLSVIGLSLPVFWSGLLIMLFFSLKLRLLPPAGMGGIRFLIMPALTLALPALATLTRISRTTLIDLVHMPYVRTARAKGLREKNVLFIHVFKNALLPLVTVIGLDFGSYLNGAVLTETIFAWDGIGRYAMEGIIKRDYPVIMGCIIVGTTVYVLINLAVDIAYHYLDPRVRLYADIE